MPEQTQGTTAIERVEKALPQRVPTTTFAPTNLAEAMRFAEILAKSGMVPKEYVEKPEAIVVAIQMGMEVGLQPMQAIQNISVINGRPSIWGDGALALVKTHPEFEYIKEDDLEAIRKNSKAVCSIKRRGQPEVKVTFSVEDAKMAGLWGRTGPWTTYWPRMLQMRARGFAIRDSFPDALKGIILREEAMDIPPAIDGGRLEFGTAATAAAEAAPIDPLITMAQVAEFYKAWKESGWHIADAKAALKQLCPYMAELSVEQITSDKIRAKDFENVMNWAKSKPGDAQEPPKQES